MRTAQPGQFIWKTRLVVLALISSFVTCGQLGAQSERAPKNEKISDTGWLDIEDLSQVRVVSATRKPESVQETAAAVAVLTSEDLRRSGVTSIPEALRLIPGVDVARINSNRYAISVRGFSAEFSDKLLVLLDGRSVFTPQFSGVFWDMQDVMLEDVDRIEVVRGPGGTAWGANAFNGVINIVTKSAKETQGGLVTGRAGTFDQGRLGIRYGGKAGGNNYYRIFAQGTQYGETLNANGNGLGDQWSSLMSGFRFDSEIGTKNQFMLMGGGTFAEPLQYSRGAPDRFQALGGHLLGRWQHASSDSSKTEVQVYYDGVRRNMVQNAVNTDTLDLDTRHLFEWGSKNRLNMGFNYRYISTRPSNSSQHYFIPPERGLNQVALFVEDQIELKPDRLYFSVGLRMEYYSLAGWEPLPTLRLCWTPSQRQTLWTSVSRGYRSPSTSDSDLNIKTPFLISYPALEPETEKVMAYQGGYRGILTQKVSYDLAGFFNQYSDLATYEPEQIQPVLITRRSSLMKGHGWGGEAALTWQSLEWWRWRASYTFLETTLSPLPQSQDQSSASAQDRTPQHQFQLWWSFQLASKISADTLVRFVDERSKGRIPSYWSGDLRFGYRPFPSLELALVGQNLFAPRHLEFSRSPGFPANSEIPRGFYTSVTWHF